MVLSSRLPLSVLIDLCRTLRHSLGAGLMLRDVFRQQAKRAHGPLREVVERIAVQLEAGHDLRQALKDEGEVLPPLFVALAGVGEQTGMLPEVFGELEKYFVRQQKLRRQFLGQISWPVFQLAMAILVIAGLIFFLGVIAGRAGPGMPAFDPLGFGLKGGSGALIFLAVVLGGLGVLAGGYWLVTRRLGRGAEMAGFLLGLPALGPCLRALALARFCLALRLTTETGMSIMEAMRLSLRATSNEAYTARVKPVVASLKEGQTLTAALALAGATLFPEDFRHIIAVAEESGRLTEVLRQQADVYDEEAGRRLAILTNLAGYIVWLIIGGIIVFLIFRMFFSYLDLLSKF